MLKHGTFAALTKEEAIEYGSYESNGFPIYAFIPFNKEDAIATKLIQASANPFKVIDNIIDFFELS